MSLARQSAFFITDHKPLFLTCLTCGMSFLLHSVNLILFTLFLVHLIVHISPDHSPHLCSNRLSLHRLFTSHLNSPVPQILSSIVFLVTFVLPSWILDSDRIYWEFVCFSFFFYIYVFGHVLTTMLVVSVALLVVLLTIGRLWVRSPLTLTQLRYDRRI